jgi:hypothetical protein
MANSAYLGDDGILYSVYDGELDGPAVQKIIQETWPIIEQLVEDKKPVLALADLRAVTRVDLGARRYASKALKQWPFDKVALWGGSVTLRHIANLVAMATNHSHNVKTFANEETAKKWLTEPIEAHEL